MIEYCNDFWYDVNEDESRVFQIFPKVNGDSRGNFTEIFKVDDDVPNWMKGTDWIKQINRSESTTNVFRGMHAQKGEFCQSKLVECVTGSIIDVILDARPQSETFGKCKSFELSSVLKNRLFVPKGFLHGFYVKSTENNALGIFQYFIGGNVYNRQSEVSVNPKDALNLITDELAVNVNDLHLSDKDLAGMHLDEFLSGVKYEYENGKLWYV